MSKQLDILALEPFFGGNRRSMLETLIRCSRHRWTLLKLPPRRIERRLAAAAHWFAEQLTRHWVGHVDLLFTSEALNLTDFFRFMPSLSRKPTVVYFHSNQLPDPAVSSVNPALDYANLNTASSASEIWFNSKYHVRAFLAGLAALVASNEELAAQNPIAHLTGKIRYMPPPVDMNFGRDTMEQQPVDPQKRSFFVETRNANIDLLNAALSILARRGDNVELITVGPVENLTTEMPRQTVPESDLIGQVQGIMRASAFVSARIAAEFDEHAVRALGFGSRCVLPRAGVYPELLPKAMHGFCLYDVDADSMASRMQDALYLPADFSAAGELERLLSQFDGISACRAIDDRLAEIAAAHGHRAPMPSK